jgi:tetratricopeptide (TPR) repeat protein
MATETWEESFERAMRLRDERKFDEALRLLETLMVDIDKPSRLLAVNCQLGNIYSFELEAPEKGEAYFRKATELKPSSELSSLGLFHSLMGQRKVSEALSEMRRFISEYPSEEYAQLRKELGQSLGLADREKP